MDYIYMIDGNKKRLVSEANKLAFESKYPNARLLSAPETVAPETGVSKQSEWQMRNNQALLANPGKTTVDDVEEYTEKRVASQKKKEQAPSDYLYQLPDGKKRSVPIGNKLAFESKYPDAEPVISETEDKVTAIRARGAEIARRILREEMIAEGSLPPDRKPTKAEEWDAMVAPPSNVFTAMLRKTASAGMGWGQTTLGLASFLTDFAGAVTGKDIKSDDTFLGDWSEDLDAITRSLSKDADDAGFTSKLASNSVSGLVGMAPNMILQSKGMPAPLTAGIREFGISYSTDVAKSVANDEANPDKVMRFVDATVRAGISAGSESLFRGIANQGGIREAVKKMSKEEFNKFIAKEVVKVKSIKVLSEIFKGGFQEGIEGTVEQSANTIYDALRGKETGYEGMDDKELVVAILSDLGTTFVTEGTTGIMMSGIYSWDAKKQRMRNFNPPEAKPGSVEGMGETLGSTVESIVDGDKKVTPTKEISKPTFTTVDSAKNVELGKQIGKMLDLVEGKFKQGKPVTELEANAIRDAVGQIQDPAIRQQGNPVTESEANAIRDAVSQIQDPDIRQEVMNRFDAIKKKYGGEIIADPIDVDRDKLPEQPKQATGDAEIKTLNEWRNVAESFTKEIDSIDGRLNKGDVPSIDEISNIESQMKRVVEEGNLTPGANVDQGSVGKWNSTLDTAKTESVYVKARELMNMVEDGKVVETNEIEKLEEIVKTISKPASKVEPNRLLRKLKTENKHLTREIGKQDTKPKEKLKKGKPEINLVKTEKEPREVGKSIERKEGVPVKEFKKPAKLDENNRQPIDTAKQIIGAGTEREFAVGVKAKGNFSIVELDNVMASHYNGERNPYHLAEMQPKERTISDTHSAYKNAIEKDPSKLLIDIESPYDGAININSRGEVIQGNNRAESLGFVYDIPAQAKRYKDAIIKKANEFGFTDEQISLIKKMDKPILTNLIDIDDKTAIQLGAYKQEHRETGGERDFDPLSAWRKLDTPKQQKLVKKITQYLTKETTATINTVARDNSGKILGFLAKEGAISNEELKGAFSAQGGVNQKGMQNLKGIIAEAIISDVTVPNREKFWELPSNAQTAMVKLGALEGNPLSKAMNRIIESYNDLYMRSINKSGHFSFNAFASETNLEGIALEDISTPEEYSMINLLSLQDKAGFNAAVRTLVADVKKLMDGDSGDESMFSTPREPLPFKESLTKAIEDNNFFNGNVDVSRLKGKDNVIAKPEPKVETKPEPKVETKPEPLKSTPEQPKTVEPATDTKTESKAVKQADSKGETSEKVLSQENAEIAYGSVAKKDKAVNRIASKIENDLKKIKVEDIFIEDIPIEDFFKTPFKSEMLEGFKESKDYLIPEVTINNFGDLYAVLQIHRSPYIEKSHIVYLDADNKVVGNQMFTYGMSSTTPTGNALIMEGIRRTGAKSFYLSHNHPSGDVTASGADLGNVKKIAKAFKDVGYRGSLILNHNKYAELYVDKKGKVVNKIKTVKDIATPTFTKSYMLKSSEDYDLIGKALTQNTKGNGVILSLLGNKIIDSEIIPADYSQANYDKEVADLIVKMSSGDIKPGMVVIYDNFKKKSLSLPSMIGRGLPKMLLYGLDPDVRDSESASYGRRASPKIIYSSFDVKDRFGYKDVDLSLTTFTPEFEKKIYPDLRKTMNKVGWTNQDLADYISVVNGVSKIIIDDLPKGILPEINKSLKLIAETMNDKEVEFIDRSSRFHNAPIPVLENKQLTTEQRLGIKTSLEKYNKKIMRADSDKKLAVKSSRPKVNLNAFQKYYYNLEDLLYYMTEKTGDVRFTRFATVLPKAKAVYEAEGKVVVKLLDKVKPFIKSKADNILLGNYIQQIGDWERIKDDKEFYEAAKDLVVQLDSTKGVIAMSRVYDAISGIVAPGNRKFYTKPQQEQIQNAKSYFGDYYKNQKRWEEFFDMVMYQVNEEGMADLYPGLEFDYSMFTIKNFLPIFLDAEIAKDIAEQSGEITEKSIEDAYEGMQKDNAVRADTTKVRTGKAKELDDTLNLAGGVLLRALRLKYLDRPVRRLSQIANPYMEKSDWRLLNNNLRHILGQSDYGKVTKAFRTLAGWHYKFKVISRVFTLPAKNVVQTLIGADKPSDIPKVIKSLFNSFNGVKKILGEDGIVWALAVAEQKSNIAEVFALQKGITDQIETYERNRGKSDIQDTIKFAQKITATTDILIKDMGTKLYMASDKLNRLAAILYNLEMITDSWEKMTTFDKFLNDVRFYNIPDALARQLLSDLDTKGISEFARGLTYYRTISTNYEYNRGLGSLYANQPGVFWSGFNQYRIWARRFTMNYARKINQLVKKGRWKELGQLLASMLMSMLISNEFVNAVFGKFENMLTTSQSAEDVVKRAMNNIFSTPATYNVSTFLPPFSTVYNIEQFVEGKGNLDDVAEDMFLGATMSEFAEFSRSIYKTGSNTTKMLNAKTRGDKDVAERKGELAITNLDIALGLVTDYSSTVRLVTRITNVNRENPYWKTSMLRMLGLVEPDITYRQEFDSEYAKFVYILTGIRDEKVKGLPKKPDDALSRKMKSMTDIEGKMKRHFGKINNKKD